ncbi:MAG: hypothetical protein GYB31_18610 [Bacteroidetes bacterium]|nr:hypothetical protein [Bacteroidota bacterium]
MGRYLYSPILFILFFLGLTIWCQSNPFFWDTIQLSSKHAHWYFEQNFSQLLLPENMDSGHPPLWGMYLAACWKVFGQSLEVSHWAVFPFLLGIAWFGFKLGEVLISRLHAFLLLVLICLDPVLLGQASLVSPDLALLCFFLMALNGFFRKNRWLLVLGIVGLCLISMRGMMTAFGLFLFAIADYFFIDQKRSFPKLIKILLPYAPGGLLALGFLIWHHQASGWIGYHEDSPWAESFSGVDLKGFFKNVAVIGWRFLDFGRVVLIGVAFWLIRYWWKRGKIPGKDLARLAGLFIMLLVVSLPGMLLHVGLSGHRYLLPVFLVLTILVWYAFCYWTDGYLQRRATILIALAFLSAHFWVYPRHISQQWDASLGYLPYLEHRAKIISYLDETNIPYESVGTVFPNVGPMKYRDLNEEERGFEQADLDKHEFIFYSNIMNDFSDEELETLFDDWDLAYRLGNWPVETMLFKRREE